MTTPSSHRDCIESRVHGDKSTTVNSIVESSESQMGYVFCLMKLKTRTQPQQASPSSLSYHGDQSHAISYVIGFPKKSNHDYCSAFLKTHDIKRRKPKKKVAGSE